MLIRALLATVIALGIGAATAQAYIINYYFNDQEQTFVIPSDVFLLDLTAIGGAGGNGSGVGCDPNDINPAHRTCKGGQGGWVHRILYVTPGTTLYFEVGANGANDGPAGGFDRFAGGAGGVTGTSSAAGGGGGATEVLTCPLSMGSSCPPGSVLMAAGGGGGGGDYGTGTGTNGSGGNGGDGGGGTGPGAIAQYGTGWVQVGGNGAAGGTGGEVDLVPAGPGQPGSQVSSGLGGTAGSSATGCAGATGYPGGPNAPAPMIATGGAGGNGPDSSGVGTGGGGGGGGGGFLSGGGGGGGGSETCSLHGSGGGAGGGGGSNYTAGTSQSDLMGHSLDPSVVGVTYSPIASPASAVQVHFGATSITADGNAQTTVTATVVGNSQYPTVPGEHLTFASNDPAQKIGPVTDLHDGRYTATVTASTTAGPTAITATDSSASPAITGHATLVQTPGPPAKVTIALSPPQITVLGTTSASTTVTTATAKILDQYNNQENTGGASVKFSSTDPGQAIGPVTDNHDGTYTTTITASSTEGPSTITAVAQTHNLTGTAKLQTFGAASTVQVSLAPAQIAADGAATTTATATVSDQSGDKLVGEQIVFSSTDRKQAIGAVTDHGDGTYTAMITGSTKAGASTITATDANTKPPLAGTATLTETAGPPVALVVSLQPPRILADGRATAIATATVADQYGNATGGGGDSVSFASSDPDQRIGRVSDHHNGTYTTTITASTTAGPSSITAIDSTATPNLSGTGTLDELTPPPAFTPPRVRGAHVTHRNWREPGGRAGHLTLPVGTTFAFTIDEPATVKLQFVRRTDGRRAGHTCLALTRHNAAKQPCTRYAPAGAITVRGHAGRNRISFAGRLGNRRLPSGSYKALISTIGADGLASAAVPLTFSILG